MTIAEYELRTEAYNLRQVEKWYGAAISAWMSRNTRTFDRGDNAVFIDFNDFLGKQEAIDQVRSTLELGCKPLSGRSKRNHMSKQGTTIRWIKEYQRSHPRKRITDE